MLLKNRQILFLWATLTLAQWRMATAVSVKEYRSHSFGLANAANKQLSPSSWTPVSSDGAGHQSQLYRQQQQHPHASSSSQKIELVSANEPQTLTSIKRSYSPNGGSGGGGAGYHSVHNSLHQHHHHHPAQSAQSQHQHHIHGFHQLSGLGGHGDLYVGGSVGGGGSLKGSETLLHHQYTEAKPIYEQLSDHGASAGSGSGGSSGLSDHGNGLHAAFYALHTGQGGGHGAETSGSGGSGAGSKEIDGTGGDGSGFIPSWSTIGKLSTSFTDSSSSSAESGHGLHLQKDPGSSFSDKISEGNFLHHYDGGAGQGVDHVAAVASIASSGSLGGGVGGGGHLFGGDFSGSGEHGVGGLPSGGGGSFSSHSLESGEHDGDSGSNFLGGAPSSASHTHTDVINYVPYPVVKKLHVPFSEPVKIPVSHAVIIPISKPVPIHVPVPQHIQVPVEKELKIPVERVIPYPVEKHVPVPVEKKVPFNVIKYVPVKVPQPFPVKVPVIKTILHKIKSSW